MMTGRDNIRHGSDNIGRHEKEELLKTGGFTASGGNHMWAYTMHKDSSGQWVVIRDDQYNNADRVVQRIPNLQAWLSGDVKGAVQKNWRAHPARPGDNNSTDTIPVPRPTPRPNPHYRPSDDNNDDDNYNDNDYGQGRGRVSVVQMARPVWRQASRHW